MQVDLNAGVDGRHVPDEELDKWGLPKEILNSTEEELEQKIAEIGAGPKDRGPDLAVEEIPEDLDAVLRPEQKPEAEAAKTTEQTETAAAATPEPEADIEKMKAEAERERYEAQRKLEAAHQSRLAGRIGYLESRLKQLSTSPELGDESEVLSEVRRELEGLKSEQQSEGVLRAIATGISPAQQFIQSTPELRDLPQEEFRRIIAPYEGHFQRAKDSGDAATAEMLIGAVSQNIIADLKMEQIRRMTEAAKAKRAADKPVLTAAKMAAHIEQTATPAAGKARPRSIADLTPEQQEKVLDKLLRMG